MNADSRGCMFADNTPKRTRTRRHTRKKGSGENGSTSRPLFVLSVSPLKRNAATKVLRYRYHKRVLHAPFSIMVLVPSRIERACDVRADTETFSRSALSATSKPRPLQQSYGIYTESVERKVCTTTKRQQENNRNKEPSEKYFTGTKRRENGDSQWSRLKQVATMKAAKRRSERERVSASRVCANLGFVLTRPRRRPRT